MTTKARFDCSQYYGQVYPLLPPVSVHSRARWGEEEEGDGWWAWGHPPGRRLVGGLRGVVGDCRPDLDNKRLKTGPLISKDSFSNGDGNS